MISKLGIIVLASACASQAHAQASPGTSETFGTYAYDKTTNGELYGCEIVFKHALQDYAYKQGATVLLDGSVAVALSENVLQLRYKLVVTDVANDSQPESSLSPTTLGNILLVGESGRMYSASRDNRFESETVGGMLAGYPFDDAATDIIDRIYNREQIGVAYNRKGGVTDVKTFVDLKVPSENHPDSNTIKEFAKCMAKLMSPAVANDNPKNAK